VIYGNKEPPILISVDPIELQKELRSTGFFSRIYELEVENSSHRVLPRDIQLDPVTDVPLHVDFMRFSKQTRVVIEVSVDFQNEENCPGLKTGGVLNVVRYAIELRCSPENVPESIPVDLSGLIVGDSIHISALTLPEDVELTITDRDFTIATIAAPTVVVEEVETDSTGDSVESERKADEDATEGAEEPEKGTN
jgi:large subunit ribosomal protein L25